MGSGGVVAGDLVSAEVEVTEHEIALAKALGACSFLPGSSQKRFARDLAFVAEHSPDRELTDRQRHYLQLMAWRYRRQIPKRLVPESKPEDLPPKDRKAKKAMVQVPTLFTGQ